MKTLTILLSFSFFFFFLGEVYARTYPFPSGDVDAFVIDGSNPATQPPGSEPDDDDEEDTDTEEETDDDETTTSTPSGDETGDSEGDDDTSTSTDDVVEGDDEDEGSGDTGSEGESSDSSEGEGEEDSDSGEEDGDETEDDEIDYGEGDDELPGFDDDSSDDDNNGGSSGNSGGNGSSESFTIDFDADSVDDLQDEEYESIAIEDIETRADLEAHVKDVVSENEFIKDVHLTGDTLSLKVTQPARLLWVIPVKYTQTVTVTFEETSLKDVDIDKPWWTLFTAGDNTKQLEEQIRTEVTRILEEDGELTEAGVESLFQKIAAFFSRIVEMLKAFGSAVFK